MKLLFFIGVLIFAQAIFCQEEDPERFVSAQLYSSANASGPLERDDAVISVASLNSTEYEQKLISQIDRALKRAVTSQCSNDKVFKQVRGMSSLCGRRFLNELLKSDDLNFRYLEIGSWKGSTFVSALYGNEHSVSWAMSIDNHSQFTGGLKEHIETLFKSNCEKFLQPFLEREILNCLDLDCFKINPADYIDLGSVNVYFYDGHHSAESQKKAFTHYDAVFSETFIAIVDDWLIPGVRNGTYAAFRELGYQIVYEASVPVSSALVVTGKPARWWQGTYIAVISKKQGG